MKSFEDHMTEDGRAALAVMLHDSGEEKDSFDRGYAVGLSIAKQDTRAARQGDYSRITQIQMDCLKLRGKLFVAGFVIAGLVLTYCWHMFFQHWR